MTFREQVESQVEALLRTRVYLPTYKKVDAQTTHEVGHEIASSTYSQVRERVRINVQTWVYLHTCECVCDRIREDLT